MAAMTLNPLNLYLPDLKKRALGENTENTQHKRKTCQAGPHPIKNFCSSNVLIKKMKKGSHALGNTIFAKRI